MMETAYRDLKERGLLEGFLIVSEIGQIQLVHDIPEPVMGEYDALVQVLGCGVCNSTDIKVRDGKFKGLTRYPACWGMKPSERVIAVGAKVSKYHIGDVVLRPKNKATEVWYGLGRFCGVCSCGGR